MASALRSRWRSEVTGVALLGKLTVGPANDPLSYKRRSPEYV